MSAAASESASQTGLPAVATGNRARLLAAGFDVLSCGDTTLLQSGINPDRIARAAGVSRQTFYRHFPNKLDFMRSVAESLHGTDRMRIAEPVLALIESDRTGDFGLALKGVISELWSSLVLGFPRTAALECLLRLGGSDPEIRAAVLSDRQDDFAFQVAIWQRILDESGLELLYGWTIESFVSMFQSIIAGCQHHHSFAPDEAAKMFRRAVLVLAAAGIGPKQADSVIDLRDATDRIGSSQDDVLNVRQRLIDSVVSVVGEHGYHGTTVSRIADHAEVDETAVLAVGSIAALICLAISPTLTRLNRELSFDEAAGSFSPNETVDRHLQRVATAVAEEHALFSAFAMVILESGSTAAVRSTRAQFHGPLAEILVRNSLTGRGRADQMLQRTIVGSMFGWTETPQ